MTTAPSRDALTRELEFLVRSLDDLEEERAAGDLDEESYGRLRREYIEREAAVRRTLDGVDEGVETDGEPSTEPAIPAEPKAARQVSSPWRGRALLIGGIVAFAVVAAVVLMLAVSDRLPGQTASGNSPDQVTPDDREANLAEAVDANPDDPVPHLNLARFRLSNGDFAGALEAYDNAAQLDPANPEASTYGGWVLYLAAQSAPDPAQAQELVNASVERLDAAVAADPDYADARAFRGIVRFRGLNDPIGAIPDFQQFLAANPEHQFAPQIRELLEQAIERDS
jgi:cytochrome c-type biogenesis protein CcmH/NrfG